MFLGFSRSERGNTTSKKRPCKAEVLGDIQLGLLPTPRSPDRSKGVKAGEGTLAASHTMCTHMHTQCPEFIHVSKPQALVFFFKKNSHGYPPPSFVVILRFQEFSAKLGLFSGL